MTNKEEYEPKVNKLSLEIDCIYMYLEAINEIIDQSNVYPNVYEEYCEIFYRMYYSFYDQVIHGISRIQDSSKISLSLIKLLEQNIKLKDKNKQESIILEKIQDSKNNGFGQKIKTLRNELGRAHLDNKVATDITEQKRLYEESKMTLVEIKEYVDLLDDALNVLFARLDISLIRLTSPGRFIRPKIQQMFKKLNQ